MAGLRFFFDAFSQPSRAVWLLLEANRVEYQPNIINIAQGANKNEDFLKISPNGTVPAIDDNGFYLFESSAIMKYCVSKYQLPDHWYPLNNLEKRARIDEYLSWHSGNFRLGAAGYMFFKYIEKKLTGKEPDETRVSEAQKMIEKSIRVMENHFLKSTPFISGQEISIADIQCMCEFTQFWIADKDITKDNLVLHKWMDNCKSSLGSHFDDVHAMVYVAQKKGAFK